MRRSGRLGSTVALAVAIAGCGGGPAPGSLEGWNVLLVTIDTLRADRLGFAGWPGASTPTLDDLAGRGAVFEDAVAVAPVTLPSHASLLTGLYPPAHGALDNGLYPLPEGVPTLAGWLGDAGYESHAVVGTFILHRKYGLAREFDDYDDRFARQRTLADRHLERRAGEVTDRAAAWLRSRAGERPFFLWVHYYDPHLPYDPPAEYRLRFALDPYDGEIAYTDAEVGRLLEALRSTGEAERTLIVVVADHGEALGDGGETTHGLLLRNATLRVPFLLVAPGVIPGQRVPGVVSQVDAAPTILALLGVPAPGGLDGESLLARLSGEPDADRFAYSHTRLPYDQHGWSPLSGIRTERWAWVRAPRPELYDRIADPGERDNLADLEPEVAADLDARLEAVEARQRDTAARALDPEDVEALEALGYATVGGVLEATGADPKDMLDLWRDAYVLRDLLDAGKADVVVQRGEELLARDPRNAMLLMTYGQALLDVGRNDEGIRQLELAYRLTGSCEEAGTVLARQLCEVGRAGEGQALLEEFIEAEPDYSEHWFNLGVLHSDTGHDAEAVIAYERSYELNPRAIHVMVNLASAMSRLGENSERAVELIDRAIATAVDDDRPRLVRASILRRAGRVEEARAALRELAAQRVLHGITSAEIAEAMRELP